MAKIDVTKTIQNFGKIKNAYNEILVEGVVHEDKDKKNLFKTYVNTVKDNEALKNQFLIYNLIENKVENNESKAKTFVDECVNIISKHNIKEIFNANKKLTQNILYEKDLEYENKELHENITTLIFTPKTPNNIDTIIEAKTFIVNYIVNNKSKVVVESIDLPNSMISTIMVDKYNEKYSTLDESEKKVIKTLIDSDDTKKIEVYNSTLRECIDMIDIRLIDSDLEAKDKLLRVKDKLLNDKIEINENFIKNISKLVELRSSLK